MRAPEGYTGAGTESMASVAELGKVIKKFRAEHRVVARPGVSDGFAEFDSSGTNLICLTAQPF